MEMERDSKHRISLTKVTDRLSSATGISKPKLAEINSESRATGGRFESPKKRKRYTVPRFAINVDDFDRAAIRRTVHRMYEQKEYPTLNRLLAKVRASGVFRGGRTTLFLLLKRMGFRYHKMNEKIFFYERRDIIQQRHKYLRLIRKYRKEGRPIVYLDETWANSSIAPERLWLDEDGRGGWKRSSGKGRRLIILHAGSKRGWVPNCALVFRSKKHTGDYHDEMNGDHFLDWFENNLLKNNPQRSVIVLDNAPYHNVVLEKVPTKSSKKAVMQEWLTAKNIPFETTDLKAELFAKISDAAPNRKLYKTNELAE